MVSNKEIIIGDYEIGICVTDFLGEDAAFHKVSVASLNENLINVCKLTNDVIPVIGFSSYYDKNSYILFTYDRLPYIVRNGKFEWLVSYESVTLSEFIHTHNISLNDWITIESRYPIPGASGSVPLPPAEVWETAWSTIKMIAPYIVGSVSFLASIVTLKEWFSSFSSFKEKNKSNVPYPNNFVDAIYKRSIWNHYELAELFNITYDDAKNWLKVLKYGWDYSKKAYTVTDEDKAEVTKMFDMENIPFLGGPFDEPFKFL